MKLDQVPYGQIEQLRLRWSSADANLSASVVAGAEAELIFAEREALPILRIGADVLGIEGDGRKHEALLADLCTRHLPRIAWVVDRGPQALTIQVHNFLHGLCVPLMELGIDEKVLETLESVDRRIRTPTRALEWLGEQFLLDSGKEKRGFVTADTSEDGAFAIFGRTARAFIRKVKRPDQSEFFLVDRIIRGRGQNGGQLALLTGDIRFVDATVAGKIRADAAAQLSSLVTSGSGFLETWNEYGKIEKEATLRRAREAGWVQYDHVESLSDGRYRFTLAGDGAIEAAKKFRKEIAAEQGLSIDAVAEVPDELTQEMPSDEPKEHPRPKDTHQAASFTAKFELNERDRVVTLKRRKDDETAPPAMGVLIVSLRGDKKRLERRAEAENAIREARCPMPQLGLLLENRPVPVPRCGNIGALSPAVKGKVFGKYEPTETQKKAIWTALNTPDIALIQGPPGTGKTTIIVALVERLQEIWDTSDGVQGRLLLSGFQHDAVENAIQRMNVNGLPPIKFGAKSNAGEDEGIDATINRWCSERIAEIRCNLPPRPASAQQQKVSDLKQSYVLAPGTLEQTASLLRDVRTCVQHSVLTQSLTDLARELDEQARIARVGDPKLESVLRRVRALRCEAQAFADDGPHNARTLRSALTGTAYLDVQAQKLLETAARWSSNEPPPFLKDLRALRRKLLLALIPADRSKNTIPRIRDDVLKLLSEVEHHLGERHSNSRDAAGEATWSFLSALENDPEAVKLAVISYTSVFAATCQQSARQELAELKGAEGYDTVVVDEAARANPLDLFIPLARAKRRIVLVGDHRQLPHIIDSKLERELEELLSSSEIDAEQRTSEMLKESLFERLFKNFKERQEQGEFTRVVTLDEQYRMHPVLGNFVSNQFYAAHGEAFKSPGPASDFAHSLPGYSGPAAWLRVPGKFGHETPGKSKSRQVEAEVLVAELKRLMDSEAGRNLTFGVISFYKSQVELIGTELERAGMTVTEDNATEILEPYRDLSRNGRVIERLRYGTVDAFQGMEFDVVFLSMVRSNTLPDGTEEERRRKYGHLMLPNRTCVAMSRQKRLLITVGDDGMLRAPNARKAIGPVAAFFDLSEVRDATGF